MKKRFEVILLEEALEFVYGLDRKSSAKILYNIDKSSINKDPELFKKLNDDIWEFRTRFNKKQFRLLAFWDKRNNKDVLVIATHGFMKKTSKVSKNEIKRAEEIMKKYLSE